MAEPRPAWDRDYHQPEQSVTLDMDTLQEPTAATSTLPLIPDDVTNGSPSDQVSGIVREVSPDARADTETGTTPGTTPDTKASTGTDTETGTSPGPKPDTETHDGNPDHRARTYTYLAGLAGRYGNVLQTELAAKVEAEEAQRKADEIKDTIVAHGYVNGGIDGKNAETRRAQESTLLAEDQDYQAAVTKAWTLDKEARTAEAERKHLDTLVGLTKAWLYSQSSIG